MSLEKLPFNVYSCFTEKRYGGNIGAIVWNAENLSKKQMQRLANEFKAPVTGFVVKKQNKKISARFFMPNSEIDMCGHVTIGLFTELSKNINNGKYDFLFDVPAGKTKIYVEKTEKNIQVMIGINLPKEIDVKVDLAELSEALQISKKNITSESPVGAIDAGLKHLFINLGSKDKIKSLSPDFESLKKLSKKNNIDTIACFALSDSKSFKTLKIRDFCPSLGVNEVPASGTTNGALIGYLLKNKLIYLKSQTLIAQQGLEIGRPSKIITKLEVSNGNIKSLKIGGSAVPSHYGYVNLN